jgi:hypothetical protein
VLEPIQRFSSSSVSPPLFLYLLVEIRSFVKVKCATNVPLLRKLRGGQPQYLFHYFRMELG